LYYKRPFAGLKPGLRKIGFSQAAL